MNTIKKVLIVLIFLITCFCLYLLYSQRTKIKNGVLEGFNTAEEGAAELNSLIGDYNIDSHSISSYNNPDNLELKQYCIKASYSTPYQGNSNGNYVSLNMIELVINRGCRFLDFEIFADEDNNPVIGFSNRHDNTYNQAANSLSLTKVLNKIDDLAFYSAPNKNDPMFVHLRIKTGININDKIGQIIQSSCNKRLHKGKVYNTTKLGDLSKKIIIVVDRSIAPDYINTDLSKYINMESSTNTLKSDRYMTIAQQNFANPSVISATDNTNTLGVDYTDILTYRMVLPDYADFGLSTTNPTMEDLIKNYGVQIICYAYYQKDQNLEEAEKLFGEFRSGIIPLSKALTYNESE